MALLSVALELAAIVLTMLVTAALVIVGPRRLVAAFRDFRWRLEVAALPLAVLASVLVLRWGTADVLPRLSERVIGIRITGLLFEFERTLFGQSPVAVLQSFQTPELTSFFVFIYIYGYAFLLLFPFVAYFALEEMDELSTLILAYTVNYGIGLVCYVLFIAFGPRNFDTLLFEDVLYSAFPESGYLTYTVNESTNVFPSLHTSMAMTTFFLAILSRKQYPLWVPVSGFIAISVVVSTMYLGIHWFSDVAAGIALAAISVYVGVNYSIHGIVRTLQLYIGSQLEDDGTTGSR
ncbi:phosphatase PAP2 family protein [Natrononativus amylolyticus]|uniref:phosphatase PAP2 family protein n=1 Tax=Natrononativus amylolyticus TaxID=2963434 RepID=UPI0020CBA09B|nr:phosphatase PAP2 family protein [Natrononativus amylolyticus]